MRRPPAAPAAVSGLLRWAEDLVKYITTQSDRGRVDPRPVLLEHIQPGQPPKAERDGIIMFDPVTKRAVISVDGAWLPLQAGND